MVIIVREIMNNLLSSYEPNAYIWWLRPLPRWKAAELACCQVIDVTGIRCHVASSLCLCSRDLHTEQKVRTCCESVQCFRWPINWIPVLPRTIMYEPACWVAARTTKWHMHHPSRSLMGSRVPPRRD
jgi:hypothetical protein